MVFLWKEKQEQHSKARERRDSSKGAFISPLYIAETITLQINTMAELYL